MTCRVVDCHSLPPPPVPHRDERRAHRSPRSGLGMATLMSLVLVPLAGAAEPPAGWIAAALAALVVVLFSVVLRGRAPWGWLALSIGVAGIFLPRGPYSAIGPALFVACALCCVFWLARRGAADPRPRTRVIATRDRLAQQAAGRSARSMSARCLPPRCRRTTCCSTD